VIIFGNNMIYILDMDLIQYAKDGDLSRVKQLIQKGTNVNSVNESGQSALFHACENGHYDVTKYLLMNGALVNYRAKPLIAAARKGHSDCVDLLLKHGVDVLGKNAKGETAMSVAVQKMNVSVILSFIDHGVTTNIPVACLSTKLFVCAKAEDAKMFCKMLNNRILSLKSDECIAAAFVFAFKHGSLELASDLLCRHLVSHMEQVGPLAVYYSVRNNWYDILTKLLEKGVDVNIMTESRTPLFAACELDCDRAVCLLLKYGANPNLLCLKQQPMCEMRKELLMNHSQNKHALKTEHLSSSGITVKTTPLLLACEKGLLVIVNTLLRHGADPNLAAFECLPLTAACEHRHHEIVKLLLEHGADVQATVKDKKTPLYHALKSVLLSSDDCHPDLSTVNLLLDYGADTNTVTSLGESPLYVACSKGLTTVVQRMLKCGAKVNVSKNERSPLSVACKNKNTTIVELLLHEGADPNVPGEHVSYVLLSLALHNAAAGHASDIVDLLLNHGADVNIVDAAGNTALHTALHHTIVSMKHKNCPNSHYPSTTVDVKHQKVVDTLLNAGADVNISNRNGETSLFLAVETGCPDVVNSMLSHGGNPNIPAVADDHYTCMLSRACEMKNVKLVEMLLKAGADPNLKANDTGNENEVDTRCELPLCIAVMTGSCELATLLLNSGAKVNMLNSSEESALYLALKNMFRISDRLKTNDKTAASMTKLLLEHGADVTQLMPHGLSPLYVLLSAFNKSPLWLFDRDFIQKTLILEELMQMLICSGAKLDDSLGTVEDYTLALQMDMKVLATLCDWHSTDQVSVELLKSGSGFILLAFSCRHKFSRISRQVKSIRLCQAAIMAGYVPSNDELEEMQESGEHMNPRHVKLLSWFNEDRQQVPSLMRQCRVAIRQQLSVASCYRTILPAIDQLPLPSRLQQYLKFEGSDTEVDLADLDAMKDENDTDETSTSSVHTSDVDDSEWSDDYDYTTSEHDSDDYMVYYDSDYMICCDSDDMA